MTAPAWYVPPEERHRLPPSEREESDQYDDEHGITAQRIRQQDSAHRRFVASQKRAAA